MVYLYYRYIVRHQLPQPKIVLVVNTTHSMIQVINKNLKWEKLACAC